MKHYGTYIFDLDGTLLDTLDDLTDAVNAALASNHMPRRLKEEVRRMVGNGVRVLIQRAVPEETPRLLFEKVFDDFRQYYKVHALDKTTPYDGIVRMIDELKQRGCRMAVVSNKMMAATQLLVGRFFPEIRVAIGEHEDEGIRKKPAPDTVFEALRRLGVSTDNAVYVGDSDVDIMTAQNSGLPCISVLWGFRDKEFLASHGATVFAASPEELYL